MPGKKQREFETHITTMEHFCAIPPYLNIQKRR